MIVRIKYCGGCNARYDRTAFVKRLRTRFPSIRFTFEDTALPDFALVVCGCPVKCAAYESVRGRVGRFVSSSEDDFSPVCAEIERVLSNSPDDERETAGA
ncbi:MAG: hypothetical protein LBT65_01975 [Synergistaceae bacterium]|nr:hypothetical protein [Synergistaceae bacterium]